MKKIIVLIALMSVPIPVGFSAASELTAQATFLSNADISTLLKRMPPDASADQPLRIMDGGAANVGIFVVRRPQEPDEGCTIEHDTLVNDKTTSIFFVLEGAGTIVTGGKLVQPAPIRSNDPDLKLLGSGSRGSGIQDGQSRRITAGDVVIIPPGVPHGFSAIEKSITYEVVRIDSEKILPLKSSSAAPARGIPPLACDRLALSPEIQKRHFDVVGPELLKLRKSARETEDGYDFEFPVDEKTFQLLSEWAMQERLCCPFLDISLRFEREGGPLWLRLAGRKGVYQDRDGARWDQAVTRSFLNLLPPGKTNECGNMRQRSRAASQVSTQEFERLGLRVHDFLAGVRLHDLWAVDLPRTRPGITLDEFLRAAGECPFPLSPVVRALVNIRLFIGRLLGWGARAGGNRVGNLRNTSDNRRSLEVACAGGNAPGSFSHRHPPVNSM